MKDPVALYIPMFHVKHYISTIQGYRIQFFCLGDEFALLRVYNRKMNYIEKYPAKFGEILKMYKYWLNL